MMARCGCTPKCNCVLVDGICTSIDLQITPGGCGDSTSTLAVNAVTDDETVFCGDNGLEARLNTLDTNTIDLEGDGSAGDPLEANVILTPDAQVPDPNGIGFTPANLIQEGTPGIYVSCEDVQDCVGAAIDAVTSDCLEYDDVTNTISILICAEPNGIECVPAGDPDCPTGGLAVFPSADVGNSLTFGTDDRLYSPASALIPGECMVFTGAGTAADPFVITPLIAPEPNGVECVPGTGLLVTPSTDAGNGLVFGTDTRLWIDRCPLTLGGSQILIGDTGPCFEFVGGDDCVTPMVATLRISDDDCNGLMCGADGLYVQVDQTALPADQQVITNFGPFGPFNGTFDQVVEGPTCLTITNPSPCRAMTTSGILGGFAETGRTSGAFRFTFDISSTGPGGPFFQVSQMGQSNPTPASRGTASAVWSGDEVNIGPGASRTICSRLTVNAIDPGQPVVNGRVFAGQRVLTLTTRWTTD